MRTTGRVVGYNLCWLGYLYCFVMLWVNVIQWWGWSAIWAFIFSPILALAIPIISWIVEGTFPVLLLAGWGAMILGAIILNFAGNDQEEAYEAIPYTNPDSNLGADFGISGSMWSKE